MAEPDDRFLARWSRRKRGVGAAADAPASASVQAETAESTAADPARSDIVDQLPDIDSLDENADFTVFLKHGVPEELRKRALRRLWRLNPVFANLDGLNDYDEDFTAAAKLLEGLKTAYQVGKGMPDPAKPAEPETGQPEAGGVETGPAPAGGESAVAADDEAPAESEERGSEQVPEAGMMPVADRDAGAPPQGDEAPSVGRRADARSGRSAAERRWGRPEG